MLSADKQLQNILNDTTSGSSEILLKLNNLIGANISDRRFIRTIIKKVGNNLSHFTAINMYIKKIDGLNKKANNEPLNLFLIEFDEKITRQYDIIFKKAEPLIKDMSTVLTISNSYTLLQFLKRWQNMNKPLNVIVCESRPMLEGRIFAKALLKNKIKVELITDVMAGLYMNGVDCVLIGADSVLLNGNVVNKVGSKTLAVLCKHFNKPFYVVTTKDKFIKRISFTPPFKNPNEIWNYKDKNLRISNVYFEVIENKFITKIISD